MTTHMEKLDEIKDTVRTLRQELTTGEECVPTPKITEFTTIIAENVPAIVVDLDTELILASSPLADELFGYIPNELVGRLVHDLVPETVRDVHAEHMRSYKVDPKTRPMGTLSMNLQGLRKDGELMQVEIGLRPQAWKGKRLVIATILRMRS